MIRILQNLKTGTIELVEVSTPSLKEGHVLVETRTSIISAGTERMLLEFGRASLLGKARQQPEMVRGQGIKANPAIVKCWLKESAP